MEDYQLFQIGNLILKKELTLNRLHSIQNLK